MSEATNEKVCAESGREALAVRLERIEATIKERVEAGEPIVPAMTPAEVMAKAASIMEAACSRTIGDTPEAGEATFMLPAYTERIEVTIGFACPDAEGPGEAAINASDPSGLRVKA